MMICVGENVLLLHPLLPAPDTEEAFRPFVQGLEHLEASVTVETAILVKRHALILKRRWEAWAESYRA